MSGMLRAEIRAVVALHMILQFAGQCPSQDRFLRFENISVQDGLSHTTVYCITQDAKGFLWIGTENGLNRYDGYEFKVYLRQRSTKDSLTSNRVTSLCSDSEGVLWIGTFGGNLNRYDAKRDCFETLPVLGEIAPTNNRIRAIREDASGALWVGTEDGLISIGKGRESAEVYKHRAGDGQSLSNNLVYSILEDSSGDLWVGTHDGLNRMDRGRSGSFQVYRHDPDNPDSISDNRIRSIIEDLQGNIWIGTFGGGLNCLQNGGEAFSHFGFTHGDDKSLSNDHLTALVGDGEQGLWAATFGGGINYFDFSKRTFTSFKNDPANPQSICNNRIWTMFQDESGDLWIGTYSGLSKLSPAHRRIRIFKHIPENANTLSNNRVWTFHEDGVGRLWIGTDEGLNIYDRQNDSFTAFKHGGGEGAALTSNVIRAIHQDADGIYWIGTDYGGLDRYDPGDGTFTAYMNRAGDRTSLSHNSVFALLEDREGFLWIGTFGGGLNLMDKRSGLFTTFIHDQRNPASLSHNIVWSLLEDGSGVLWVGTYNGLNRLAEDAGSFQVYLSDESKPYSLSHSSIYTIYEDSEGFLLLGTDGGGLNIFDRAGGRFYHYTTQDGLPDNVVYGIVEDGEKNIWVTTNKGIARLRRTETDGSGGGRPRFRIKAFDSGHGLHGDEFNLGACYRTRKGEIVVGGEAGFTIFAPKDLEEINLHVPPVVITEFQLFNRQVGIDEVVSGRNVLPRAINEMDTMVLSFPDNYLTFKFSALDFTSPTKNRYAYKMEGLNADWIDNGTARVASFHLRPGEYTFSVKGSNNDGVWNESGAHLHIVILPPFWETWWFQLGLLLAVLALAIAMHKLRTRAYRRRNIELREINERMRAENEARQEAEKALRIAHEELESKIKEITQLNKDLEAFDYSVSNALRVPLRHMEGFATLVMECQPDSVDSQCRYYLGKIRQSARNVNDIINSILRLSRVTREGIRKERLNLSAMAKVSATRTIRELNCQGRIAMEIEDDIISTGDNQLVQILLDELLENAVKHCRMAPHPRVEFGRADEGGAAFFVRDNGVGFDESRFEKIFEPFHSFHTDDDFRGVGLGLATAKRIVTRHGGRIWTESAPGLGATFYFTLG